MKTIVGSRALWPTPGLASSILTIMISTDEHFYVRAKRSGETTMTETLVTRIGARINRDVTRWQPVGSTRASTFRRDISMVDASNEVFAFFAPDALMTGGTGHVVYCALRRSIPVHAFEVDVDGAIIEVASDDGELVEMYKEAE